MVQSVASVTIPPSLQERSTTRPETVDPAMLPPLLQKITTIRMALASLKIPSNPGMKDKDLSHINRTRTTATDPVAIAHSFKRTQALGTSL